MLEGKIAVITGGTRGIGYATVRKFLKEGATVVFFGSSDSSISRALGKLKEENPKYDVSAQCPDLKNIKQVRYAIDEVIKKHGKIDILVNNAGISDSKSFYDYEESDYDNVMDLNIKGVYNTSRVVSEYMKENGGGVILNTSSMVSIYGQSRGVAYPTSKGAVNALTKSLARELGKDGIRVNAVLPGVIHTDMVDELPQETIEYLLKTIPLGRMGEPDDIANAFVFLASDNASYITGATLSVDGACIN